MRPFCPSLIWCNCLVCLFYDLHWGGGSLNYRYYWNWFRSRRGCRRGRRRRWCVFLGVSYNAIVRIEAWRQSNEPKINQAYTTYLANFPCLQQRRRPDITARPARATRAGPSAPCIAAIPLAKEVVTQRQAAVHLLRACVLTPAQLLTPKQHEDPPWIPRSCSNTIQRIEHTQSS